jgi:hypothetical protein
VAWFSEVELVVDVRTVVVVDVFVVLILGGSMDGTSWKTVKVRRDIDCAPIWIRLRCKMKLCRYEALQEGIGRRSDRRREEYKDKFVEPKTDA